MGLRSSVQGLGFHRAVISLGENDEHRALLPGFAFWVMGSTSRVWLEFGGVRCRVSGLELTFQVSGFRI